MEHANLVANELEARGFETFIAKLGVEVFLKNRPVNNMEVREALEDAFEGIEFTLLKVGQGILVNLLGEM